jgi:hypothetical protein
MAIPTRLIIILSRQAATFSHVLRVDGHVGQEAAYAPPDIYASHYGAILPREESRHA